jgi:hypothetical protein
MRTAWKATGIALAALAAVAATTGSAAAYAGSGVTGTCTGTGPQATTNGAIGQGQGMGRGMSGGMGVGRGTGQGQRGAGLGLTTLGSGTLTSAQRTSLAGMAEEEKLAHDVYVTLATKYPGTVQFSRISGAEAQHLTAVRVLLDRYDMTDPTRDLGVGQFTNPDVQALYDTLIARATTPANALAVGVTIEEMDIADLDDAMAGLTAPDVLQVYTNLQRASERHLAAFGG